MIGVCAGLQEAEEVGVQQTDGQWEQTKSKGMKASCDYYVKRLCWWWSATSEAHVALI